MRRRGPSQCPSTSGLRRNFSRTSPRALSGETTGAHTYPAIQHAIAIITKHDIERYADIIRPSLSLSFSLISPQHNIPAHNETTQGNAPTRQKLNRYTKDPAPPRVLLRVLDGRAEADCVYDHIMPTTSLKDALHGKRVVEFPTFLVVLEADMHKYKLCQQKIEQNAASTTGASQVTHHHTPILLNLLLTRIPTPLAHGSETSAIVDNTGANARPTSGVNAGINNGHSMPSGTDVGYTTDAGARGHTTGNGAYVPTSSNLALHQPPQKRSRSDWVPL